jgi:L-alanine-DL-glutamate epimerase-like enolase superfamily enzyme
MSSPPSDPDFSRRDLFKTGAIASSLFAANSLPSPAEAVQPVSSKHLTVKNIKRTTVKVPFREVPARNMDREIPHWRYSEIVEVELSCGVTGFGETLLYYTWGATEDDDVARAEQRNAAELMWDDSLGAGLQMALFDAVARASEVPVHALLGTKIYDETPLSWWNIDTSPEDMVLECKEALRQGYMAYKTKGRPWIDLWQQIEQSCRAVPEEFKIDMDFNDTLLDAERAIPILKEFEKYPQIDIYETPIFQDDIEGNQRIRAATRVGIAQHYGNPDPYVALKNEICDGFVVGHGAREIMQTGAVCEMAGKKFWLQLVGTGITAAFSLHFGGVLRQATWPAVNCHQLYTHILLTEPIAVMNGNAKVPDRPGLGYELDRDEVAKFKINKPKARPEPERLIETIWPDGRKMYIANDGTVNFMLNASRAGKTPFFEKGVKTRLVPDDGTSRWRELYEKARKGPLFQ